MKDRPWTGCVFRSTTQTSPSGVDSTGGSPSTAARGIPGARMVAGAASTADGAQHASHSRGGAILDRGTLGGSSSRAFGVNGAGQEVRAAATAGTLGSLAVLYSRSIMTV